MVASTRSLLVPLDTGIRSLVVGIWGSIKGRALVLDLCRAECLGFWLGSLGFLLSLLECPNIPQYTLIHP